MVIQKTTSANKQFIKENVSTYFSLFLINLYAIIVTFQAYLLEIV